MMELKSVKNIVVRATSLSLLAMLVACGGSDDEPQTDCTENILILFLCAIVADSPAPTQDPIPAGVSTSTGNSAANTGDSGVTAVVGQADEFEPNNVLGNANIVTFPNGADDAPDGVEFKGSVRTSDDVADYLIFTPNTSGSHRIYLCADTCDDSLEDDAAYIMIYDQNQTTIAGTPIGTIARQEIAADLTAGLAYYVEVNGYNAGSDRYDYRLVVIDY